jgi:hypothetical protein
VLALAFARRLSWYSQAALWAVYVEGLTPGATERRLGRGGARVRLSDASDDLRRAYLQLRSDLDEGCLAVLRRTFGLPQNAATVPHPAGCRDCLAQRAWLDDLGAALRGLKSPLPPAIWEAIKSSEGEDAINVPPPLEPPARLEPPVQLQPPERPKPSERLDSSERLNPVGPIIPLDRARTSDPAGDQGRRAGRPRRGSHVLRSGPPPARRTESATMPRGRRSHARGSRAAAERMKAPAAGTQLSTSSVMGPGGTAAVPLTTPVVPTPPVTPAKSVNGTSNGSVVTIPNDSAVPAEQSKDRTTITLPPGLEAVATSSPGT